MRGKAENNESKDCGCIVQEQPCLFTFCCKGSIWDLSFFYYFSIRGNVFATGYVGGLIKPSIIEYGLYFLSWTGRDSYKRFAKAEIQ